MSKDKDPKNPYLPDAIQQNPAPVALVGQQNATVKQDIVNKILTTFRQVLASNYVAQVPGPYYYLQFQAAAETLADIQILLTEASVDSNVDFTRPEYLWQMVGTLVFPDTTQGRYPVIDGDLTFRCFLKRMIELLLQGATLPTQEEGLELLTDARITVLEKVAFQYDPNTAWGLEDQHTFEINVEDRTTWTDPETGELIEGDYGTGFPADPFVLQFNNSLILRALKPAKALYDYRHLFRDNFGQLFVDSPFLELEPWYYEDFRKFCSGMKEILSSDGETLANADLLYFQDVTVDFRSVCPGAVLEILDGPNTSPTNGGNDQYRLGVHQVVGVFRMLGGADETSRAYTTSPTGLTGNVTVGDDGVLEDPDQDFSNVVEGEVLTISDGPNAGSYRLDVLLGANGGPISQVPAGSGVTGVQVAPCILELKSRMIQPATGQFYRVSIERLGVRVPYTVLGEDVSAQFYL
jgi:hypothetical protein